MLKVLELFREKLDEVMIKAIGKRVVLYGYDRTGQFLEWYADYYHSIKMDYIIVNDWPIELPKNFPLFSDNIFDFNYKDVKDAVVWLTVPEDDNIQKRLQRNGYIKNETWFSFLEIIYENQYMISDNAKTEDVFLKRKSGKRDIQFMEWLEHIYDCNYVEHIYSCHFEDKGAERISYVISTQKEIFPILDRCHCNPQEKDAIFDFGCGKGGALISFLDYGFKRVGGVEYEKKIFEIMISNFKKLGISTNGDMVSCIQGDAMNVTSELDNYNWFYYFEPFRKKTFVKTIENIVESLKRKPRKIHIININPSYYDVILESGFFLLTNQFWIATRQKVVDVFVTKREFE
ncbi:MAG: hypothetical protein HFI33_13570 [Lachnospiraceae bacterium]|nr:hypothetical protein [Lachnospiraceae bacterium]